MNKSEVMSPRYVSLDMHGKEGFIGSCRAWLGGLYKWTILQHLLDPAFSVQALQLIT